jgi:hypothetical protein
MLDNSYSALATKVSNRVQKAKSLDNSKMFDPATILLIIRIIVEIVKCYLNRRKLTVKEALEKAKNPNLGDRIRLGIILAKTLDKSDRVKYFGNSYTKLRVGLMDELMTVGEGVTEEDANKLLDDYKATEAAIKAVQTTEDE